MRRSIIKELLLYRYRYVVGYTILAVLGIGLTVWQLGDVPPGFSDLEKQSAVLSSELSRQSASLTNLPYHILQKGTLALFGPSSYGIRLPSVIAALIVAVSAYFLLRRWFGENIAVIGTMLVITSVHFLLRARSGDPAILYYLWPALLLLAASYANMQHQGWRIWVGVFAACAALSLYTPYVAFLLAIILITTLASRQGRALAREIDGPALALSGLLFVAFLSPLIYNLYENPSSFLAYIGIAEPPTLALISERLGDVGSRLAGIGVEMGVFTPALSVPALILGLYGIFYALKHAVATRYAIVILWLFTSLALFLSTKNTPAALLFVPLALTVIIGFRVFINHWYVLFPRNPYARIAALLPIALLLLVTIQFNYERYFYGLPRSENVRKVYDGDILLLEEKLATEARVNPLTIVVSEDEQPFFSLLEKRWRLVNVTTLNDAELNLDSGQVFIAQSEQDKLSAATVQSLSSRPLELIVDDRPGSNALRYRVYK